MCVEQARGYPQMRDHSPACLLERGSLISLPQLPSGDSFLSYCPCGPQPDTPQVSPAGSRAPGVEIPTLMTPPNLYSGEPGASLGFSGPKDVSRIFPQFLIIFFKWSPVLRLQLRRLRRASSSSLPLSSPPTAPTAAPGRPRPPWTFFSIVGNDRIGSGDPNETKK